MTGSGVAITEDAGRPQAGTRSGTAGVFLRRAADLPWARWSRTWLPILFWLAASCVAYSKFLAHPTRSVPGGPDGVLYAWYFESVQQAVWHLHNPLFSDAMNAPVGVNVMWNTALIIVSLVTAPLTALIGAIPTVGLMMLLAPVLSATASYIALRRITGRDASSAVASTMYGFGPFFVGQAGHLHLTFAAPLVPVVFYLGHRLFIDQQTTPRRVGIQLGASVGVAMLISEEIVAIAAIMASIGALALALLNPESVRSRVKFASQGLGWAVLVAGAVIAIPLAYQFKGPLVLHAGIPSEQSVDLAGLVKPSQLQRFGSVQDSLANQKFPANAVENTGYLGWPLIIGMVALAVLLIRRRYRFLAWWLVTMAASITLSFGAHIFVNGENSGVHGPWALVRKLPVIESLVAVRFSLTTTFLVSVIIAFSLAELRKRRAYVIGCVASAAVLLTLLPAQRYDEMLGIPRSRFFTDGGADAIARGAQTLVLPQRGDPYSAGIAMYWQIQTGLRFDLVGGYSVFSYKGMPSYVSYLPLYAQTLQSVADTGRSLSESELTLARASVADSGVKYFVLSSEVRFKQATAVAAAEISGCTPETIKDAVLCRVAIG